jgi:hypothetical protein
VADFLFPHGDIACKRMVVDWETGANLAPLYSLVSLYKYAKACPASPVRVRPILSNKIGAAHHWPSSVWIWRKTINPLMSYIKLQITPPSPLIFAILRGVYIPRSLSINLRVFAQFEIPRQDRVRVFAQFEIRRRDRGSSLIQKKRLVEFETLPSIIVSILRFTNSFG